MNVKVEAAKAQIRPWIIHVEEDDPGRPLTKSIAGPNAFSSMNMLSPLATSLKIQRPFLIRTKNSASKSQKVAKVEIMTSIIITSLAGGLREHSCYDRECTEDDSQKEEPYPGVEYPFEHG